MTNAAQKCFIAHQSRLTPTFVSSAVFCARSRARAKFECTRSRQRDERAATRGSECSLQRDRRPRPLEILSSSAVNREVGSFASSEVNRALKAATTFTPFSEGCCFLYPSLPLTLPLPCLHRVSRCGQEVQAATLEESNKASRYDAAAGLLRCM